MGGGRRSRRGPGPLQRSNPEVQADPPGWDRSGDSFPISQRRLHQRGASNTSAQSCFTAYATPTPSLPETTTPAPTLTVTPTTQLSLTTASSSETSPQSEIQTTSDTAPNASVQATASSSTEPSSLPFTTITTTTTSTTSNGSSLSARVQSASVNETTNNADGSSHDHAGLESATIGTSVTSTPASGGKSPESSVSSKAKSDTEGTSKSALWIALASCGGGVVLLIMLSVFIRRRKERAMEAKVLECLDHSGDYVPTGHAPRWRAPSKDGSDSTTQSIRRTRPTPRLVCLDDDIITAVRVPYGKLTLGSLVSRGGFGEVYRGMYRGKSVAIKRLLPERRHDVYQIENFLDEVKLMASLEHDHVVRFVGVAWETVEELCVVTEFMALGDLRTLLGKYDLNEEAHRKGFTVDKLKIALHVAKALTYMHALEPCVLHRDIKSRNILLDDNLNAKVTDFGVSRERAESTMTTGVGSTLWMAPEVMAGGRYNEKADVFSFGVVLSELDTHHIPYSHVVEPGRGRRLPDTVIVQMMTLGRITVEFTARETSPMAQLGRRCVEIDPSKRPSAKEVEEFIQKQWKDVVVAL